MELYESKLCEFLLLLVCIYLNFTASRKNRAFSLEIIRLKASESRQLKKVFLNSTNLPNFISIIYFAQSKNQVKVIDLAKLLLFT